jgi:hypothetical protein
MARDADTTRLHHGPALRAAIWGGAEVVVAFAAVPGLHPQSASPPVVDAPCRQGGEEGEEVGVVNLNDPAVNSANGLLLHAALPGNTCQRRSERAERRWLGRTEGKPKGAGKAPIAAREIEPHTGVGAPGVTQVSVSERT